MLLKAPRIARLINREGKKKDNPKQQKANKHHHYKQNNNQDQPTNIFWRIVKNRVGHTTVFWVETWKHFHIQAGGQMIC